MENIINKLAKQSSDIIENKLEEIFRNDLGYEGNVSYENIENFITENNIKIEVINLNCGLDKTYKIYKNDKLVKSFTQIVDIEGTKCVLKIIDN